MPGVLPQAPFLCGSTPVKHKLFLVLSRKRFGHFRRAVYPNVRNKLSGWNTLLCGIWCQEHGHLWMISSICFWCVSMSIRSQYWHSVLKWVCLIVFNVLVQACLWLCKHVYLFSHMPVCVCLNAITHIMGVCFCSAPLAQSLFSIHFHNYFIRPAVSQNFHV